MTEYFPATRSNGACADEPHQPDDAGKAWELEPPLAEHHFNRLRCVGTSFDLLSRRPMMGDIAKAAVDTDTEVLARVRA